MPEDNRDETVVHRLFASAGITPTDEELALFVAMYPMLRAKADRIYELDLGEAR
jgi:hypothetical protein